MLINIPPFLSYVRSEFIYDNMDGQPYFQDATAFAISSQPNETLKFQILVGEGRIHTVSIAGLTNSKEAVKLSDEGCSYSLFNDDNDDRVSVIVLEYLAGLGACKVNNKNGSYWQDGQYVFTVENLKQQLHLIELQDGNYVFWGNEGLVWGQ